MISEETGLTLKKIQVMARAKLKQILNNKWDKKLKKK
jgi:hypothetical protein